MLALFAVLRAWGASPASITALVGETLLAVAVYLLALLILQKLGLCSTLTTGWLVMKRAWTR